jgi:hypothetical protein
MREIQANFRNVPRLGRGWWSIPLALLVIAAGLGARTWSEDRALQQLQIQQSSVDVAQPDVRPGSDARPFQTSAQEFVLEYRAQWMRALSVLESVKRPGVVVGSVESNAIASSLSIQLLTADHDMLIRFLSDLNESTEAGMRWSLTEARATPPSEQVEAVVVIRSR